MFYARKIKCKGNNEKRFFRRIVALEHPRFVMQYRSKSKQVYIDKYIAALNQISWFQLIPEIIRYQISWGSLCWIDLDFYIFAWKIKQDGTYCQDWPLPELPQSDAGWGTLLPTLRPEKDWPAWPFGMAPYSRSGWWLFSPWFKIFYYHTSLVIPAGNAYNWVSFGPTGAVFPSFQIVPFCQFSLFSHLRFP